MTADDVENARLPAVIDRRYSADACFACFFVGTLGPRANRFFIWHAPGHL